MSTQYYRTSIADEVEVQRDPTVGDQRREIHDQNPLGTKIIHKIDEDSDAYEEVTPFNPLPVINYGGGSVVVSTDRKTPPGIGTGAAYANLDAIGTGFYFVVPLSGIIQSARYFDLDDEGLQVDLVLFDQEPTSTTVTDNSALAVNDLDLVHVVTVIPFTAFSDLNTGQFSSVDGLGVAYNVPNGRMYAQLQARGALNIAAANLPAFQLSIVAD